MIAILALVLLAAPQEDDSKRAREAALGLPGIQAPPAPTPAPAPESGPPASFMAPRVKRAADDYKDLMDHNVFSPPRPKKDPPKSKDSGEPPKPETKTRKWTLTGIVLNGGEKRYEALIEDQAAKESKFCKVGDTIAGVTITEVTFDQVAYKKGETPGVLKLMESLTETVAGGANGSASGPVKVEDAGEVEKARERMKKRHKRESVPDEAEEDADTKKKPKQ